MTESIRIAELERQEGRLLLISPEVGLWREGPSVGRILRPRESIGRIETLGVLRTVLVPDSASGMVVERFEPTRARAPVDRKTPLVVLDPEAAGALREGPAALAAESAASGLVLPAPMGGRFYARPGPGKPPFVAVGAIIEEGHTVGLIEVMKTFNRVLYGGPSLPNPARVVSILSRDDQDLSIGDALIEVEPV